MEGCSGLYYLNKTFKEYEVIVSLANQFSIFQLDGSLIIEADNVMGSTRIDQNGEPILQYGHR